MLSVRPIVHVLMVQILNHVAHLVTVDQEMCELHRLLKKLTESPVEIYSKNFK